MLEYIILLFLALSILGAARKRRRFNLRRVRINGTSGAGALAALDVATNVVSAAVTNTMRFISLDAVYSLTDLGAAIDDAFEFGVAHSDYSAAEIEEALEASGSMDLGDKVAMEQANRLVRTIGTISPAGTPAGGGKMFNDGKPVKTRLNWLMAIGDTLNVWIRNGSGVVWTSGAGISILGNLWVKDAS